MKKVSEMDSNVLWDEIAEASQGHVFASQARFELQRRMKSMSDALAKADECTGCYKTPCECLQDNCNIDPD